MLNGVQDLYMQPDGSYATKPNCLGCAGGCAGSCYKQVKLGAVADYDIITVGGVKYTANQVLDKTVYAQRDTPIYVKGNFTKPAYTIKAGQPIGKVYSYLKPSDLTGGRSALMFYTSNNNAYYAFNEDVSSSSLKDQGALTLKEEVRLEEEERLKNENPTEYYIKKYGFKALLIIGGVVLAATFGKEAIKSMINKKSTTASPALSGVKKSRTQKRKQLSNK